MINNKSEHPVPALLFISGILPSPEEFWLPSLGRSDIQSLL